MGTYSNGANGKFSGKVGSMVGSKWRSVSYIKGLPAPSSKPATEKQMAQRAKFALAVSFLRPIKDVLNLGMMDNKQDNLSGYNLAVRRFLTKTIQGDYPDYTINFPKLVISQGPLNPVNNASVAVEADELKVTWQSLLNKFNSFADDELIILFYNSTKNLFMVFDEIPRSAGTFSADIGVGMAGDTLHSWVFACERNLSSVSATTYLGEVTLSA